MPKRKLVEITPRQHRQLKAIRAQIRKSGQRVPSIPLLVQSAVDLWLPGMLAQHLPPIDVSRQ
jgi:hypothetical protein